jgi:cytochrome c biogenesis protein CcdA
VLALLLLVVSVGLADSVNPSTLAPALVLATRRGAVRQLAGFTLGVFVVSLAGGLALLLGPGQLLLDALPHPGRELKHVIQLVGGVVLVGLGAAFWLGRHRIAARMASAGSANANRGAFALGAGIMAVELPTAVPYYAVIGAILATPRSLTVRIAYVVLYNVAFVAPLLALLAVRRFAGEGTEARLDAIGTWLRERGPAVLAMLLAVLGVVVATFGIVGLV